MDNIKWWKESKIIQYMDSEKYYEKLAVEFLECAKTSIIEKGCFIAVLGGGNTPKYINQKIVELSGYYKIDWKRVYIILSDERYIEEDNEYSNYKMMMDTLVLPLRANPLYHIFRARKSVESATRQYAEYIERLWRITEQNYFDYALLGVGGDGHTASLFPKSQALEEKNELAVYGGKGPEGLERISLSFVALNRCRIVSFLVNSPKKERILCMMQEVWNPQEFPIQNIISPKNMYVLSKEKI